MQKFQDVLLDPRGNRPPNQIARLLRLGTITREVAIESQNRRPAGADRDVLRVERASRRCRHQPEQQRGHRRNQPDPEPDDILRLLRGAAPRHAKRSAALPDVPSIVEAGFKGQEADTLLGVLLPACTPKAIVTKVQAVEPAPVCEDDDICDV